MYGYAGVNPSTFKLVSLNEAFDVTRDNYRQVTNLKRRFPGLRVLLSVGGGVDNQDKQKYLSLVSTNLPLSCQIFKSAFGKIIKDLVVYLKYSLIIKF